MIRDSADFRRYLSRLTSVFDTRQRLPNMVFKEGFSGFSFTELDWAMSADFWPFIQGISADNSEESVLAAVLEPDPVGYFYREFGEYNLFDLHVDATSDDYWSALEVGPEGSPADAALYNSDVIVWVPSSMNWAIWGQRDLGVCVFASRSGKGPAGTALHNDWLSVDEAVTKLLPLSFQGGKVPEALSNELRSNYNG